MSVSAQTVKKIWKQFCATNNEVPKYRGGSHNCKLTNNDLELIETLKVAKGSISKREINEILEEVGDIQGEIAMSTISRTIKSSLLSGKIYSRKKFRMSPFKGFRLQTSCIHKSLLTI